MGLLWFILGGVATTAVIRHRNVGCVVEGEPAPLSMRELFGFETGQAQARRADQIISGHTSDELVAEVLRAEERQRKAFIGTLQGARRG